MVGNGEWGMGSGEWGMGCRDLASPSSTQVGKQWRPLLKPMEGSKRLLTALLHPTELLPTRIGQNCAFDIAPV